MGIHAPGLKDDRFGFQAAHHLLLAHGLAMPRMRKAAPNAKHGIVLNLQPFYPVSDKLADKAAAAYADDENNHFFLQPLFKGTYPESISYGRPDVMPLILEGDMEIISAELDYLGVNYYSRGVVCHHPIKQYEILPAEKLTIDPVERTHIGWEVYPQGFSDLLINLNTRYSLPPVFITENGMAGDDHLDNGAGE